MSDSDQYDDQEIKFRSTLPARPYSNAVLDDETVACVPEFFAAAGALVRYRFIEFFTARIRNPNTRAAYYRAVCRFDEWCARIGRRMEDLNPVLIAAYIEELGR